MTSGPESQHGRAEGTKNSSRVAWSVTVEKVPLFAMIMAWVASGSDEHWLPFFRPADEIAVIVDAYVKEITARS